MVFSSHIFLLCFLPTFLLAYFIVPARWRNAVLLLASVVFYAWGAPDFVLVLLASTVGSFYLVKAMSKAEKPRAKKWLLAATVTLPMGLLAYFKYANFFVDNFNAMLAVFGLGAIPWSKVLLPIGISFFSFQSVTYAVDVYRGNTPPMKRVWDYMLYIIMFPQLIAGPIVRYNEIADQITARRRIRWDECLQGFGRFVTGLAKKVLIADVLGRTVDATLGGNIAALDMPSAWIVMVAYTMQLYFDFSGYSDMAIGLGRIMGFRFPENFNKPYNSGNITEFWRRWHITLGNFMRNYLYIPMGGNRCSKRRMYFNLWVVFLLSGLWHGAGWSFILWGAYHGFFLVLERITGYARYEKLKPLRIVLTFIIAVVGWALFRIEDIGLCGLFLGRMFSFDFNLHLSAQPQYYTTLILALALAFIPWRPRFEGKPNIVVWLLMCLLLAFCVCALTATNFSPFIYFRF